jgi:hypothetical protein
MKNIIIFLLFLTLNSLLSECLGQKDSTRDIYNERFMITGGINLHNNFIGELGIVYGRALDVPLSCAIPYGFTGIKIASELNFDSKNLIYGPKLSLEYDNFLFFGCRISVIDYIESNHQDYRFVPELGLSFCGYIDLFYGINIPMTNETISSISPNRLSLIINLDFLRFKSNHF